VEALKILQSLKAPKKSIIIKKGASLATTSLGFLWAAELEATGVRVRGTRDQQCLSSYTKDIETQAMVAHPTDRISRDIGSRNNGNSQITRQLQFFADKDLTTLQKK